MKKTCAGRYLVYGMVLLYSIIGMTGCSLISQEGEDVIDSLLEETAYYRIYALQDGDELYQILKPDGDVFYREIVKDVVQIGREEETGDIQIYYRTTDGDLFLREINIEKKHMSELKSVPEEALPAKQP